MIIRPQQGIAHVGPQQSGEIPMPFPSVGAAQTTDWTSMITSMMGMFMPMMMLMMFGSMMSRMFK